MDKSKSFFSNLFLIVGSVFLGLGMTAAGVIKINSGQASAGAVYIVLAVLLIAFCALPAIHGKRNKKG